VTRIFSDFVSSYPDTPIYRTAMALVRNGYAIIPVKPGTKEPDCILTSRERNKQVGHPCGVYHAITDVKIAERVFRRLTKELKREPNVGIVAHPSRLVVVDADTPEAVESLLHRWAQAEEDEGYLTRSPTVSTPGSRRGGEWRHHHGGHWYFNLPDGIELPVSPGQLQLPGGADVRWGMLMTVAPPSTRPEGAYIVHGDAPDVPGWLLHEIRAHTERKIEHTVRLSEHYANDPIIQWSIDTSWGSLLPTYGWTDTNKVDRCGCPIWEKPGGGSTGPKSATAHEGTCTVMENAEGHGALHLWTTDPPVELAGRSNVTKLQFYALMEHGGDEVAAQVALGLAPNYAELWAFGQSVKGPEPYTREDVTDSRKSPPAPDPEPMTRGNALGERHLLLVKQVADETGLPLLTTAKWVAEQTAQRRIKAGLDIIEGEAGSGSSWLPIDLDVMLTTADRDRTVTTQGALVRSDGKMAFTLGKLHQLFGQSSAGKTFSMMQAMLQQVMAGHRALYCDFEDTKETFVDRYMLDMGIDIRPYMRAGLLCYCNPSEPPGEAAMKAMIDLNFRLVVVDSLSEVVSSVNDGSMKDGVLLRRLLRRFRQLAEGGAAVVIIAHGSEKVDVPGSSLGASEIRQALTGQDVLLHVDVSFDKQKSGRSLLYIAKDRGGDTSGATDTDDTALNKVQRRLWGEMLVTATQNQQTKTWTTAIEFNPARHITADDEEQKAAERAERLIVGYLLDCPNETSQQSVMIQHLSVESKGLSVSTFRRTAKKMAKDGLVHEVGQEATGGRPSPVLRLGTKAYLDEEEA
jgi:hypothetical protein